MPTTEVVRLDVAWQDGVDDPREAALMRDLAREGFAPGGEFSVTVSDIFWLAWKSDTVSGGVSAWAERLGARLLLGRGRRLADAAFTGDGVTAHTIEIALKPGVTDTAADTLRHAACASADGIPAPAEVACGRRWVVRGAIDAGLLEFIARRLLANPVIEDIAIDRALNAPFLATAPLPRPPTMLALRNCDDDALMALSVERRLALDLDEMSTIRNYYDKAGRDATDVELETFAQTWSEHCVHKTFRARIDYRETDADGRATETEVIDGLFDTFIRAPTETLACPWVLSAFEDNAGIIALTSNLDVAVKVETHNRPSALDPFGGAHTGVGGVIRDIIGVSARPCANIDVLCFGPSDIDRSALPAGVIHPRRVRDGVIEGVADYGNKLGIPTVAGAIVHAAGYVANPLVFVGCVGVLPRGAHPRRAKAGDLLVVVGGRTGRDGLKGATFSSAGLDGQSHTVSAAAVQVGDPIMEKRVLDLILAARDEGLYHAITDCGAGGLSSAVGEMAHVLGARVELGDVPLKYRGLAAWEIWLSEAQERMVLAVPSENFARLQRLGEHARCPVVAFGTLGGKCLTIYHHGEVVGELALDFLHHGMPRRQLQAVWSPTCADHDSRLPETDPVVRLLGLLGDDNGRSVAGVLKHYDRYVQGGTLLGPLVGKTLLGPGDGSVVRPVELQGVEGAPAIVIGLGIKAAFAGVDPYVMAWQAVDEAIRNAIAVGADPERIAMLDNFAWGNPDLPDRLGGLVRACRGCRDAALFYRTPFVSGKDSLHNEWTDADGTRRPIPGTLVITAIGRLPGGVAPVAAVFGNIGDVVFALGDWTTKNTDLPGHHIPSLYQALHSAIADGIVTGCHDVSRGGFAVAAAEMTLGFGLGATLDAGALGPIGACPIEALFSEGQGRFILTAKAMDSNRLIELFGTLATEGTLRAVGLVTASQTLDFLRKDKTLFAIAIDALRTASFAESDVDA